jgi:hypothetical protein
VQAAEDIGDHATVGIEGAKNLLPVVILIRTQISVLSDHRDGGGPGAGQFIVARVADEGCRVPAVCPPAFALPTAKPGSAMDDLVEDRERHLIPAIAVTDAEIVGELCTEAFVDGAIGQGNRTLNGLEIGCGSASQLWTGLAH